MHPANEQASGLGGNPLGICGKVFGKSSGKYRAAVQSLTRSVEKIKKTSWDPDV